MYTFSSMPGSYEGLKPDSGKFEIKHISVRKV